MGKIIVILLVFLFFITSCIIMDKPVYAGSATENTWVTKTPTPQSVVGGKAAVVDGKIYVIGNYFISGSSELGSLNYQYDPATDTWTTKKPMSTLHPNFGIAVSQNKIYTIGGINGVTGESYNVNEVYDPSTDTWETKQPMPHVAYFDANVVNNQIYVMGGGLNQVYNVANDSWTTKTPMPYPVINYASAVSNGKIYIFGGRDRELGNSLDLNFDVNFTQIYDPSLDSWTLGSSVPTLISGAVAGATTGMMAPERIYLVGGTNPMDIGGSNLNQVYNPKDNTWTYGAQMLTGRTGLTVAVLNDRLYAIGGEEAITAPYTGINEQYTPFGFGTLPQPTPTTTPTVPEFPAIIAAAIILIATVGVVIAYKRKAS